MNETQAFEREYPRRPIASVHAAVFSGERLLLVKRAHPPNEGRWSLPGGVIELGETIYEAARRELREECSVEIEVVSVLDVVDNIIRDETGRIRFHYALIFLLARHVRGEARPGSDALEVRWVARDDMDGLDMHPRARRTVQQAWEMARRRGSLPHVG